MGGASPSPTNHTFEYKIAFGLRENSGQSVRYINQFIGEYLHIEIETRANLLSGATGWVDRQYGNVRLRVDPDHEVFEIPPCQDFIYTGSAEQWVVPETGQYLLEVWGADGGPVPNSIFNSRGGYSSGLVWLTQGETLWIYVGGRGQATLGSAVLNSRRI